MRLFDRCSADVFAREQLHFQPDPKQEVVLNSGAKRRLLNCTRQWGKSTVTAIMAVHNALSHDGSLTLVVSPTSRQSGEFVRKAASFVRKLGLRTRGDGDNEVSLLFPNNSRIVGLPGTEDTIRGFSAVSLLLIDEAARVPDDMYKAVRPMLATSGGALWLMSTPFGRRGFFYDEWSGPRANTWTRITVPATGCPRISPAFLDEERAAMGDWWFRQEYLCEFTGANDSLFRHDVIFDAISHDIEPFTF
jgi:hypothetical protein